MKASATTVSSRRKLLFWGKPIILGLAGAVAALFVGFAACSYGEGTTPTCDADASPDSATACTQQAFCDDGFGGVRPQQFCCNAAVVHSYEVCTQTVIPEDTDYLQLCPATGSAPACCGTLVYGDKSYVAKDLYDGCMKGDLSYATDGGTGGGAGTGGAGGGGATGGSGGATGGNGGST